MRKKGWRGFGVTGKVFERELMFWWFLSERKISQVWRILLVLILLFFIQLVLLLLIMILSVLEIQRNLQNENSLMLT
jgi:hypothetical protein